jgi:hypothetical protein
VGADDQAVIDGGQPLPARVRGHLLHRSRRRRAQLVDIGLEARSVGLALDDEVEGVVLESIDGALASRASSKAAIHSAVSRLLAGKAKHLHGAWPIYCKALAAGRAKEDRMPTDLFVARLRWQADADPCWELETTHRGFATPEDAALFANGFADAGADELRLDSGRLALTMTDRSMIDLRPEAVQIWRLPDDGSDHQVADDVDFHRQSLTFGQLSAAGLDGGFIQIKYGVMTSAGEPVDVAISLDETGLLSVTVEERPLDEVDQGASFTLGIIPKA